MPKLTDEESRLREGERTKKECWEALQTMNNDKFSSSGGVFRKLYVCVFNEINSVHLINDILEYLDKNDTKTILFLQTLRKHSIQFSTPKVAL